MESLASILLHMSRPSVSLAILRRRTQRLDSQKLGAVVLVVLHELFFIANPIRCKNEIGYFVIMASGCKILHE